MTKCQMCSMGLVSSCLGGSCDQEILTLSPTQLVSPETTNDYEGSTDEELDEDDSRSRRGRNSGRGGSRTGSKRNLADSQSSGRKQAAKLYPLDGEAPCEWQGKANCGGGSKPILGCLEGKQQARHHGPEKNVQNNEEGNVHRICHYCHYRWHAANDPDYDWNAGYYIPHQPRPLDQSERGLQAVDYMRYLTTTKRKKNLPKQED